MKTNIGDFLRNVFGFKTQLKQFKHFLDAHNQQVDSMENAAFYIVGQQNNKGLLEGTIQTFYRNGLLKKSEEYRSGVAYGEFSDYHPNGQISRMQFKEKGHNVGKDYKWYSNGQMQEEGEWSSGKYFLQNYWYDDGEPAVMEGKGELLKYEEANKTYYQETYENGYMIKGISCDEQGKEHSYGLREIMPEFPGGITALGKYLSKNIYYPLPARKKNIQGRVFVSFVVGSDGTIKDVTITQGLGYGCDEEVIRVISAMPKWIPGYQSGKAVPVKYSMPVAFTLQRM